MPFIDASYMCWNLEGSLVAAIYGDAVSYYLTTPSRRDVWQCEMHWCNLAWYQQ